MGVSRKYGFHFTDKADYDRKKRVFRIPQDKCRLLRYTYGITLEEKDKMIQDQDNKCLRCGLPFEGDANDALAPVVDHDHSFERVLNDDTIERGDPNSVKGIVHKKCNTMLGLHNDSIEELQLSIDYLKKWEVKKMERIHAQENIKK